MKYNLIITGIDFTYKKLFNLDIPIINISLKYFVGSSQTFNRIEENYKCFELVDIKKEKVEEEQKKENK